MASLVLRAVQAALSITILILLAVLARRVLPGDAPAATPAIPLPTYSGFVPTPPIMEPAAGTGGVALLPIATPTAAATAAPPAATIRPLTTDDGPPTDDTLTNPPPATRLSPPATAAPPTATTIPSPTGTPPATRLSPPVAVAVNGIPFEAIIVLPPDVVAHAREIFAAGQAQGRNPHAYAKVGDSTTENPHFMARFDEGPYNLGPFAHLQPAVEQFRGSHGRDSVAVRIGLHSWTANDPAWAEVGLCLPNETPVQCEIRLHNPSIMLIRLGTNDVGVGALFESNMRQIIDTALAAGVIPVIGTKGDRHEGSNENNDILRRLAAEYRIPLWDYDRVAGTLPGRGLDMDAAHMLTFYAHDYNDPTAFTRGHAMHNLTALMMVDALWRLTAEPYG